MPGAQEAYAVLLALADKNEGLVPEMYGRDLRPRDSHYYLRPEFAESTYMLFKATGDVRYLEAGKRMLKSLHAKYASLACGYSMLGGKSHSIVFWAHGGNVCLVAMLNVISYYGSGARASAFN